MLVRDVMDMRRRTSGGARGERPGQKRQPIPTSLTRECAGSEGQDRIEAQQEMNEPQRRLPAPADEGRRELAKAQQRRAERASGRKPSCRFCAVAKRAERWPDEGASAE